jgi:hypothetical protein
MKNRISDLRNHLFETIEKLKDEEKPMDPHRAKAIYETAKTIIDTGKLEIQLLEAIGGREKSAFFNEPPSGALPAQHAPELPARAAH